MQPQLRILRIVGQNDPTQVSFVVVDLGISSEYPQNFVCVFPKNLFRKNQLGNLRKSKFSHAFGEKTYETARNLLEDSLKRETDLNIKMKIAAMLKDVEELCSDCETR